MARYKKYNEFLNEYESSYAKGAQNFVKELEKSKLIDGTEIDVSVGPGRWAAPGELRFRDHVTLRGVGTMIELYIIPRSEDDYELYTDKSYDQGREIKIGDAKTIIKAMKRYTNKMAKEIAANESVDEGLTVDTTEPGRKKVNIMVGRFQPPTLGHLKVLKQISKENGHPVMVLLVRAKKVDKTKTPFDVETTEMMFEELAKKHKFIEGVRVIDKAGIDTIFNNLRPDYEPILWGTGTDRLKAYNYQIEKPEYREDLQVDPEFKAYEIKRNEDNISASKVRAAIKDGDEKLFQSMMDPVLHHYFPELKTQLEG